MLPFQNCLRAPIVHRHFSTSSSAFFLGKINRHLNATAPKPHVVETLNKPIGVQEKPKDTDNPFSDPRGIAQKWKDFMDPVKNKERQEVLEREMAKSGMYDVYTFRHTRGKLFHSPPTYWKAEKSLYMPNFTGQNLLSSKTIGTSSSLTGKISVVRMFSSQIGEEKSQSYFTFSDKNYLTPEGYESFLQSHPNSQIVDINVTENAFKAFFVKISKSGIKKTLHKSRIDKYFIIPKKGLDIDLRESIQFINSYSGFIYVLDQEGRIRWAACGEANESERNLLWKTVRGLEREYKALNT